jgi:chaperone required for assembly of F1-ATPase
MEIDPTTDFLDGGENSCKNAEALESANNLYQGANKHIALFLLYTSCEELEKAIFCLLVHHKHLNHEQINSILSHIN